MIVEVNLRETTTNVFVRFCLYSAIYKEDEATKSKPDYLKGITNELKGFNASTVKQLFEIFNIKQTNLESDDLRCDNSIILF